MYIHSYAFLYVSNIYIETEEKGNKEKAIINTHYSCGQRFCWLSICRKYLSISFFCVFSVWT